MILFIEALYALVFLHALRAWFRDRDPVQGAVALMFCAIAARFLADLGRLILGTQLPEVLQDATSLLVLAQPLPTLYLVSLLRPVPRWLILSAVFGYLATVTPVVTLERALPLWVVLPAVGMFFAVEFSAAGMMFAEARRRTGSPRIRLTVASVSTVVFSSSLIISVATRPPAGEVQISVPQQAVGLAAAVGYVIAFLPPRRLRKLWWGVSAFGMTRSLLATSATDSPQQTWRRYVDGVREIAGSDSATVIGVVEGALLELAHSGRDGNREPGPVPGTADDLDRVLAMRQPLDVHADPTTLAARLAERGGERFATVVPLTLPDHERAALVVLSRNRSLFADDDARVLGELGGQAAILAGRAATRLAQERLAAQLGASVEAYRAASQAKSDFLASMSHELRTPMNAIIGFSDLMREEERAGDRRLVPDEWIGNVLTAGHHLLSLINDILDLAKIEAGKIELRTEPVDLVRLVNEATGALEPLADRKGLHLQRRVRPVVVPGDPTRLRQVLDNLLSNAIKFTPPGGRITVAVEPGPQSVRLTVTDTGIGISPEDHQRVFDEFQQAAHNRSGHQEGTGLGLALARRLVQAHGGAIELDSAPGRGSKFTVVLPAHSELVVPAEPVRADEGTGGGILIIEDDPAAAQLLRTYLEAAGYTVHEAGSGEAGLAAAARRPDAILLDVMLPDTDGWAVLRRLKADPQLAGIPVFIVTVVDERDVGQALGATDYFVKPVDRRALLARLTEHITASAYPEGGASVLVIDDDLQTRKVIEATLRPLGASVLAAPTGREGIALVRSRRFDLIITDLLAPNVDGLDVLAAVRAEPASRDTPVLVLTAQDLTSDEEAALAGKVIGVLGKDAGLGDELSERYNRIVRPLLPVASATGRGPHW